MSSAREEVGRLRVGVVGTGAVASALAPLLAKSFDVTVWGRREAAGEQLARWADCRHAARLSDMQDVDVVLVAVSDAAIGAVAERIAHKFSAAALPALLHTSGASSGASEMSGAGLDRFSRGSVHPLVAVTSTTRSFEGMPFAVEATDDAALGDALRIVDALRGFAVTLPTDGSDIDQVKRLYHACATMVASGVVALVARASEAMAGASRHDSVDGEAFRRAYAKLALSAAANIERVPGSEALTGAVARSDDAMIERHRDALASTGDAARNSALYEAIIAEAQAMLDDAHRRGQKGV